MLRRNFSFLNRLSHLVFPTLWIFPFIHVQARKLLRNSTRKRSVLLIAQNHVAVDYQKDILACVKQLPNTHVRSATEWFPAREVSVKTLTQQLDCPALYSLLILLRYWDIVIFVNHPHGLGRWLSPQIKCIFINHGIRTGKINNPEGEDGVFAHRKVIGPFKRILYNKIFVSSYLDQEFVRDTYPHLLDRIEVTGSLMADRVLAALPRKNVIRSTLDFSAEDFVIHVVSTWGENSLYHTMGQGILREISRLKYRYKFLFSLHPRYDELGDSKSETRVEILKKAEIAGCAIETSSNWQQFVAASDLVISDHSSVALFHLLVNHPIILIRITEDALIPDSIMHQVSTFSGYLESPSEIESEIEKVRSWNDSANGSELRHRLLSWPQQAEEKHRSAISRIINEDMNDKKRSD